MAVGIHIATIVMKPVNQAGQVVNRQQASCAEMLRVTSEMRILEDATIPNTADFPTVKAYLEAEAGDDYVLNHMDQSQIITYHSP